MVFPPHAVFLGVLGVGGLSKLSQVSKLLQGAEGREWGGLGAPLDSGRWGFEFWLFTLSDLGEI